MIEPLAPSQPEETKRPPLARSAFLTFAAHVGSAGLSLVNVLITARALGPVGRGEVVFLMAVAMIVARFAALGVQEANVNLAGSEPRTRPRLATNSLLFATALGAAAAGLTAALVALVPAVSGDASTGLFAAALASLPVLLLYMYLWRLVQADYRFGLSSLAWLVPALVNVVGNGVLAGLGALTVGRAFAMWLAGQALSTLLLVWFVARRHEGFGRPDAGLARRTAAFGVKAHAGRVMLWGNLRLDQWLLGVLAGSRELGLYSVAVAWAGTLAYLPGALALAQRPDLVRTSRRGAVDQAAAAFRVVLLVTVVGVVAVVIAAPFLCVTIFGEEFRGSVDDLRVLAFATFGTVAQKVLGNALTAQGRPLLETAGISVGLVLTILLDIILIPEHGGRGAAIASLVAYSAAGAAISFLFSRALGSRLRELIPRAEDGPRLARQVRELVRRRAASERPT